MGWSKNRKERQHACPSFLLFSSLFFFFMAAIFHGFFCHPYIILFLATRKMSDDGNYTEQA